MADAKPGRSTMVWADPDGDRHTPIVTTRGSENTLRVWLALAGAWKPTAVLRQRECKTLFDALIAPWVAA